MNAGGFAEQLQAFVQAGGVTALVMALAGAGKAWGEAKPKPPPSVASAPDLAAENALLKQRLAEMEAMKREGKNGTKPPG